MSILRTDIFESLDPSFRPPLQPVRMNLLTATGEASEFIGKVDLKLKLGEHCFEHEFFVAEIKDQTILGMDFFMKHKVDLLFSKCSLKIKGDFIPCFTNRGNPRCCRISVVETAEIPANCEKILKGQACGPVKYNSIGVVEASKSFLDKTGLLVAKAVVQHDRNIIPLRVANLSDKTIVVKKHTIVANFEPAEVKAVIDKPKQMTKSISCVRMSLDNEVPPHLLELFNKSAEKLNDGETRKLKDFLIKFQDVFSKSEFDIGYTELIKHKINTGDTKPIKLKPYRLPLAKRECAEAEIENMAKRGLIEPSSSPWCSPIVMVTKKTDNKVRFCCDYRKINMSTVNDCQPLPRIDDTLDALSGNEWLSTLDLRSGYWQCGLEEEDREKTAFCIPGSGLWQFRVLPFGLKGAPATFERLMEKVLAGLTWRVCLVYLDDVVVYSKTFEENIDNLSDVCERMRGANLKLHPKKCCLVQNEVTFLGHKVSKEGIKTDEAKTQAVRDWPTPHSVKDVRSFIGLCSYYRRFVQDFSVIAKPLHRLTEKGRKFVWSEDCNDAFLKLKHCLVTAPTLGYPRDKGMFILDTDASDMGMGAVLSQRQDGSERVICYYSKTFSKCERNYCVTRKELLAIVSSVKHFHHYLYGRQFLVRSDHGSLRWLMNFKNPEGQLARWLEMLNTYDFTIEHRAGRVHSNADALSRRPCPEECRHCTMKECKEVQVTDVEPINDGSTCRTLSIQTESRGSVTRPVMASSCFSSAVLTNDGEATASGNGLNEREVSSEVHQTSPCNKSAIYETDNQIINVVSVRVNDVNQQYGERDVAAVQTRCAAKKDKPEECDDGSQNSGRLSESSLSEIEKEQTNDVILCCVREWKEKNMKPSWPEVSKHCPELKYYWNRLESFEIKDGILSRKWESDKGDQIVWQTVVPSSLRAKVLEHLHDSMTGGGGIWGYEKL